MAIIKTFPRVLEITQVEKSCINSTIEQLLHFYKPFVDRSEHVITNWGILRVIMRERVAADPFNNYRRRFKNFFLFYPAKKTFFKV